MNYILRVWKQNLISQLIINEIRFNRILILDLITKIFILMKIRKLLIVLLNLKNSIRFSRNLKRKHATSNIFIQNILS